MKFKNPQALFSVRADFSLCMIVFSELFRGLRFVLLKCFDKIAQVVVSAVESNIRNEVVRVQKLFRRTFYSEKKRQKYLGDISAASARLPRVSWFIYSSLIIFKELFNCRILLRLLYVSSSLIL